MVGLDAAGKTTILYKLKLGEIVTTIPTIGMDIYVFICYFTDFTTWLFLDFRVDTIHTFWYRKLFMMPCFEKCGFPTKPVFQGIKRATILKCYIKV